MLFVKDYVRRTSDLQQVPLERYGGSLRSGGGPELGEYDLEVLRTDLGERSVGRQLAMMAIDESRKVVQRATAECDALKAGRRRLG